MLVKATNVGFYGNDLKKVGDEFEIADEKAFSHNWMAKVDVQKTKSSPKPKPKKEVLESE